MPKAAGEEGNAAIGPVTSAVVGSFALSAAGVLIGTTEAELADPPGCSPRSGLALRLLLWLSQADQPWKETRLFPSMRASLSRLLAHGAAAGPKGGAFHWDSK